MLFSLEILDLHLSCIKFTTEEVDLHTQVVSNILKSFPTTKLKRISVFKFKLDKMKSKGNIQFPGCPRHISSARRATCAGGSRVREPAPFSPPHPRYRAKQYLEFSPLPPSSALVSPNRELVSGAHPSCHTLGTWPGGRDSRPSDQRLQKTGWATASSWTGTDGAAAGRVKTARGAEVTGCSSCPAPGKGVTCWCQTSQKGM